MIVKKNRFISNILYILSTKIIVCLDIICSVSFTCISSIVSFLILGEWLSNNFIRSFSIWDCVSNCCWCSILWRCWWECNWQRRLVLASTKDELWLSRAVFSTPSSPKKISYMSNQIAFMFQGTVYIIVRGGSKLFSKAYRWL